jgi:hypothetical protein
MVAGLSVVDEFAGMRDLLRREFPLASEFHASALCGLHPGAGPFGSCSRWQARVARTCLVGPRHLGGVGEKSRRP